MGRVIDIMTRATGGADGPKDWPRDCIEHDGALPLAPGAVRMPVEEYRAWLEANAATFDEWRAAHPSPEPAPPLLSLTAPRFLGLAARMLRLDPETVESDLIAIVKQHVTDPQQRGEAIILIRRATEFAPDHPLLRSLAAAAGIDSATFDSEWRAAADG